MKCFTDKEKWKDKWFRKLRPELKLLYLWLLDSCDSAGSIEFDDDRAAFEIGEESTKELLAELMEVAGEERLTTLECGRLWLAKYIEFQYNGFVSATSNKHNKIREAIVKHSIPFEIGSRKESNTYSIPSEDESNNSPEPFPQKKILSNRSQDTDKDKDKDKEQDKDQEENPMDMLQRRISNLVESWSVHFNHSEQSDLFENRGKWLDLTEAQWATLERWYADQSDRTKYRCRTKGKLLTTVDDELQKAIEAGFADARTTPRSSDQPAWLPAHWREIATRVTGEDCSALESWKEVPLDHRGAFERACRETKGGEEAA